MDIWTEYEAVKAVDSMSAIEILKYVDSKVVDCRDHTMAEYRIMAVELMKKERAA
jgi:hypothetical protein